MKTTAVKNPDLVRLWTLFSSLFHKETVESISMLGLSFGVFEINCAWLEDEGGDRGSNWRSEVVRYGRIEEG